MIDRHILSVTVRDRPGVLVRIAGLFARRGFNIESLSVAQSFQPGISRTTFVVSGEEATIEQVEKQLQKLIDVIKVVDHTKSKYVDRELMLIKVQVDTAEDRVEIRQIAPGLQSPHRRCSPRGPRLRGDRGRGQADRIHRSDARLRNRRTHSHRQDCAAPQRC